MKKHRLFPASLPILLSGAFLVGFSHPSVVWAIQPKSTISAPAQSVADDMRVVQQRLRDSLLADQDAKKVSDSAKALLATMQPDGSWKDQVYTDRDRENWKAGAHLGRLEVITRAYALPGSPLAKDPDVKAKILASLDYWLKADPQNDNWWHNVIGVPKFIGEILIIMGDEVPADIRERGTTLMIRSKMDKMTGQNLVWTAQMQIMRGCLSNQPDLVESAYNRMWQEVRYAGPGEEGIEVDGSFHQHGPLIYAGGYGAGFTTDVTRFVDYARGTRFALPDDKLAILERYVLDGQQWMVRGGQWDFGVTGRELIRAGKSAGGLQQPLDTLASLPGPRQQELKEFAARFAGKPGVPSLSGNRHYWLSDYMAQMRPGYFVSTRMYSARTLNTDGYINGENKTSHHLADGATYIALDGSEYVGIYPVWDWHRIPGTTVEQNTPLTPSKVSHKGTTTFVGGVSDGRYGAAAQDLAFGGLHAEKAWFYFDDEIVCLGAGISCASPNPVYTSLNQTLLKGAVKTSLDSGAEVPKGDRDLTNVSWVWHGGIGYIFPTPTTAHLKNDTQTGSLSLLGPWSTASVSKDVFSLWLDHGANVQNGTYAYILFPAKDEKQTADAAKDSAVEITSNTPELQSVWHKKLGILEAAFHVPGEAKGGGITVAADQPCLILLQRTGNKVRITVSNPQNAALTVNLHVNLHLSGEGVKHLDKTTSDVPFVLPGGLEAGKSVVCEFTIGR